jgi:SAM-dependent methyltransferase
MEDAIAKFKDAARAGWESFAPTEMATGSVAPKLVRFAGIAAGMRVLDVGCGTGVVAVTAARLGARVTGSDLTPKLIDRARENSKIMGLDVQWDVGDAEALPYPDAEFDAVLSQFGHMFAPRPGVAVREMLRVLKPGGVIAFSTWPPELLVGRMFALIGRYAPPPPAGASPPHQWGDPNIVRERLGEAVTELFFDRDVMHFQILSPQHQRLFLETNVGPVGKLVESLSRTDSAKLANFRRELEALMSLYFDDNRIKQDFLLTRARKR